MKLCVLDFVHAAAPVQAALDAARAGDKLYLIGLHGPPFTFPTLYQAPAGGWKVRKSLEAYGDGPGHSGTHDGTTLSPGGQGAGFDVFTIEPTGGTLEYAYLHAFKIKQRFGHGIPDGANGVRCSLDAHAVRALRLERIGAFNLDETGLVLEGADPDTVTIERLLMLDCHLGPANELGALIQNVATSDDGR